MTSHRLTTSDERPDAADGPLAQGRRLAVPLAVVLAGVVVVCLGVAFLAHRKGVELSDLTRDPSAVTSTPWYIGLLSFLGFALWAIGAGAALTAGLALNDPADRHRRRLLLQAAALTMFLLLDDMLLFHEEVLPNLGVPEKVVYGLYVVVTAGWLVINRRDLLRTEWILVALAFAGFAASIGLDKVIDGITGWTFLEDSLKFAGIALWCLYLVRTGLRSLRER